MSDESLVEMDPSSKQIVGVSVHPARHISSLPALSSASLGRRKWIDIMDQVGATDER